MNAKNGNISLILKLVLALVVVAVAGYFAWQRFSDIAVVDEVTRGEALSAVPGSVQVYADKGFRELKPDVGGRVSNSAALEPGRPFKKGDVLMELDSTDLKRSIAELTRDFESRTEKRKLQLASNIAQKVAEEDLDNAKRQLARGVISQEVVTAAQRKLDAVKAATDLEAFDFKKATDDYKAALDLANIQLEKMTVKAPDDGVIEGVMVYDGALISPGATVAVYTAAKRTVKAKISEENIGSVRVGQDAQVRLLVYPNEVFKAKVSKIMGSADDTQRFEIYLDVDIAPERLQHNQTGQVTVTVGKHPGQVLVPRRAMFNGNNVFVVKDGKVELRKIEYGFVSLVRIEVLKGLTPGELVIVENYDQFRDGQRVRVKKSQ